MEEETTTENGNWSYLKKFFFFFIFFYCLFYIFPFPLDEIPYLNIVFSYYDKITDAFILLVGNHILHIEGLHKIEQTGSGDTTFDYVKVLSIFLVSIILAITAFIIGRKKPDYSKLFYLLFTYVRYYLALNMVIYGFAKFFKAQFIFPSLFALEEHFGNSSPMGLLWKFMGYSTAYTLFAGVGEVVAGILLFFRRTLVLGALLSFILMANVAAMNFCFDVPAKLFSLHLVLFSIFILAPDAKNLYSFLILRKNAVLKSYTLPFKARWIKITRLVLKVMVFIMVGVTAYYYYTAVKEYGGGSPKPPLYGIYRTQLFIRDNDTLPPLTTDSSRWDRFIIDERVSCIDLMTEKHLFGQSNVDTVGREIRIESGINTQLYSYFKYTFKNDTLILQGDWYGNQLYVKLNKIDVNQFLLLNRGFHWINEYPFNR